MYVHSTQFVHNGFRVAIIILQLINDPDIYIRSNNVLFSLLLYVTRIVLLFEG